jgi:hypothetical protein
MADDEKLSLERGSYHDRGLVGASLGEREENPALLSGVHDEEDGRQRPISRSSLDQSRRVGLSFKWKCIEFISIALAAILLALSLVANGFAAFGGEDIERFGMKYSTANLSNLYFTEVTPANWTFSVIWGIIYLWQILWIIYAFSFPFRSSAARTLSLPVYWLYAFASACNIVWIYLFGNDLIEGSLAFIILLFLSLLLTLAFAVYQTSSVSKSAHLKGYDRWLTYVLVHNGLAFYTTWLSIAWLLNVAIVADVKQSGALSSTNAGTLALSILGAQIISWFFLEHMCLDRYVRSIQVVYFVFMVALASIVSNHWKDTQEDIRNHYYSLALLVLAVILQLGRICLTVFFGYCKNRTKRKEAYDTLPG